MCDAMFIYSIEGADEDRVLPEIPEWMSGDAANNESAMSASRVHVFDFISAISGAFDSMTSVEKSGMREIS